MEKKIKKQTKTKEFKSGIPRFKITIGLTLMSGILFLVIAIILITFTTSVDIVKSAQLNAQISFYSNLNIFNKQNQLSKQFEETLTNNSVAKFLMEEMPVKGLLVSDKSGKIVYTTFDKNDTFIFDAANPIPLRIERLSKYSVSKTSIISFSKNFIDNSYNIYLVIPKLTTEYKQQIMNQSFIFFLIIIVFCTIGAFILVRSITRPLAIMEKTVSQIVKGDLSGRLEYSKYEEINKLVKSYNMMAVALQKLYSSLNAQVNDQTRELKSAYAELKSTQAMMVHSEKMKSLGELVAGIMHEINNPINFIYGNMTHLDNYSRDLIEVIDEYTKYDKSLKDSERNKVKNMKEECDYEFLKTDMPDLIKSCKEGAERAKNIIQDLKSFSRMEEVAIKDVNLPAEIDTVLNILHNKIKNKAQVHKEYMENVPKVEAFGGQLNQVFMNILDNAVGAIEKTGDIWIRMNTDSDRQNVIIEIEDNGAGMDDETIGKVFDPFFTTKPVGQGTGLGMSISYKIIKNHQGDIKIQSKKGKGTKFIITLPLNIDRENLKNSAALGE